jgi:hypothetical protein
LLKSDALGLKVTLSKVEHVGFTRCEEFIISTVIEINIDVDIYPLLPFGNSWDHLKITIHIFRSYNI